MKKNIFNLIIAFTYSNVPLLIAQNEGLVSKVQPIFAEYSTKMIIHEQKLWQYNQTDKNLSTIIQKSWNSRDTASKSHDALFFDGAVHSFAHSGIAWDVDNLNVYGLSGVGIHFNVLYCEYAGGDVRKIAKSTLSNWEKGTKRSSDFNYQQAFKDAYAGSLPITQWFKQKYTDRFFYTWKHNLVERPFKEIADSVISNTYFDFFKLKSDDSTSFFALCEGNVLSTWHFDRFKQQKLREYPFKPTGYFHVLEHQGKPYLISAEGTVFKLGRRLKKVRQLPRSLKEGWLIVDKDHDKIYFLEQQYFSFADKPRAISDLLKNAVVLF